MTASDGTAGRRCRTIAEIEAAGAALGARLQREQPMTPATAAWCAAILRPGSTEPRGRIAAHGAPRVLVARLPTAARFRQPGGLPGG
jgi:hypothetical protein